MNPNVKLCESRCVVNQSSRYQRLLGRLNYLTITHLDIAFVVSVVSQQFLSAPWSTHLEVALRNVRYLKAHPIRAMFYGVHNHLRIEAFTHFDWAPSPSDTKSTTRYCT